VAQAEFISIKAYGHHTIEEEKRGEQQTHSESFTLIVTKRLRSKREAVTPPALKTAKASMTILSWDSC